MPSENPNRGRLQRWAAILAMTLAFIHNAALSWGKWGDLLIDCGMDMEDARMLLEPAHTLYVNPLYPYGPLIPHFNALLFKIFGINSWVLCGAGLVSAALMTCVLYRIARLFIGRLGSAVAAISFLYICAFAQLTVNGSFNFVLSYRSCAQYGALFAAASTFFLIRHARKNKPRDFWIAAAFLALAGLTKIEALTAGAAAHIAFIAGAFWTRRCSWKLHLPGYAAAVAIVLGVYGYFYSIAGKSLFVDNIFQMAMHGNYLLYATRNMGTDHRALSLLDMFQSIGFFALPIAIAALITQKILKSETVTRSNIALYGVPCAAAAFALYLFAVPLDIAFRFVPALGAGILIALTILSFRRPEMRASAWPLAILWALVVGSLIRMFFRTISYHYGFYLLPPGLVALAVVMFGTLPALWPAQPRFKTLCAYSAVGMFAALTLIHLRISSALYAQRTVEIHTPRGDMLVMAKQDVPKSTFFPDAPPGEKFALPTGAYWKDVLDFISLLPRDSRVMIVPHGASSLTFFSGLDDPYKDYVTAAPTLHGRFDDDEFLEKVKREPPDFIVKSKMDVSEYGQTGFGESYSKKTWAWLEPQYELLKEYPPPLNEMALKFIVILKRKK